MQRITQILGPTNEHSFIASNFVFVLWKTLDYVHRLKENLEVVTFSEEEDTWLQATDAIGLNIKWFRTNQVLPLTGVLFLPLNANPIFLVSTNCDFFESHKLCQVVSHSDLHFILQARYALLARFEHQFEIYSNFNLYNTWPLFKQMQDFILQKNTKKQKTHILQEPIVISEHDQLNVMV